MGGKDVRRERGNDRRREREKGRRMERRREGKRERQRREGDVTPQAQIQRYATLNPKH